MRPIFAFFLITDAPASAITVELQYSMEKYNSCYPALSSQRKIIANWKFENKRLSIDVKETGYFSRTEIS